MNDTLRLFVGIDVGEAWTERLSATADSLREQLGRSVRWVRPELYHVTVVFLGNQAPESVEALGLALERAATAVEPFELSLRDVGPQGRHAHAALVTRVLDPSDRLQRLRVELDRELRQLDVSFDSKRLVPHVTLGRPRNRSGPLQVEYRGLQDSPALIVREINLVKSQLLPSGPEYETIASAPLGMRRSERE